MLGSSRQLLAVLPLVLGLFACGSEDEFTANVGGDYTLALTNGKSTCNWDNWVEGKETTGVGFTLTQDGKALTGKVDPVTEVVFSLILGPGEFKGAVDGNTLTMTRPGKSVNATATNNCAYSYNATVDASQMGDSLAGTITYSTATNDNPDCDAVKCSATQKFNGSRAPQ
jgi:hypothetical protein